MPPRSILTAELLSIGTELTVGETRDTNAGDLARSLTGLGIAVGRIQTVPDELGTVREAFEAAIGRADLVVSTGGLGRLRTTSPERRSRQSSARSRRSIPSWRPGCASCGPAAGCRSPR